MRFLLPFLAFFIPFTVFTQNLGEIDFAKNRIIVKIKPTHIRQATGIVRTINSFLKQEASVEDERSIRTKKNVEVFKIVEFDKDVDVYQLITKLESLPYVEFAEPDYIGYLGGGKMEYQPNDPFFFRQWSFQNNGDFDLALSLEDADLDMPEAWGITQGDSSIIVAFLDTGLKLDHPAFKGRVWINRNEELNNFKDDDMNGYLDDHNGGWDFVNRTAIPIDDHGHGTNVTSIFGANGDDGQGYAGIDWNSKIMVLKVINANNAGFYGDWAAALYYAADNGADLINMSIGGAVISKTLQDAVKYVDNAGVTMLACSMNTNSDWEFFPASFSEVIAVGSTNADDERTNPFFWNRFSGSNFGTHLDVVAPGNYIFGLGHRRDDYYGSYWGGTSQAVPHATGICALLLSIDNDLTNMELREILRSSADDEVGHPGEDKPGFDIYYGYGRVNAFNALNQLTTTSIPIKKKHTLNIYPNPIIGTPQSLKIEFDGQQETTQIYEYRLLGLDGVAIEHASLTLKDNIELEVPSLPSGLYFLELSNPTNVFVGKLIVNN